MPPDALRGDATRAIGLGIVALVAGCTTLLGVDGDYAAGEGDAWGTGGDTSSSAVTSSGGGERPTTGSTTTSSTTATGPGSGGGTGAGGDASAGGGGSGGDGGGGPVDCNTVLCVDEVLIGELPDGSRNPRLTELSSSLAAVTVLVGDAGDVWTGSTDGDALPGDYVPASEGDDAVRIDDATVAVLDGGLIAFRDVALADVPPVDGLPIRPPEGGATLFGGGPFAPPLFAIRPEGDPPTTYVVAAQGDASTFLACADELTCSEIWTGCDAEPGEAPLHALDHHEASMALARVCGASRTVRVDRGMTSVVLVGLPWVVDVAVGQVEIPGTAYVLLVQDIAPDDRRLVMVQLVADVDPVAFDLGHVPGARDVSISASLSGIRGAWVEDGDDGAGRIHVIACDNQTFACGDRRLHVAGGPQPVDPMNTQLVEVPGGTLLAWEEAESAQTRVRFAFLPDGVLVD